MTKSKTPARTWPHNRVVPGDIAQAYAIQDEQEIAARAAGIEAIGYKIACTNDNAQKFVGVSEPCYARLFTTDLMASRGSVLAQPDQPCGIESEIAIILNKDLGPDTKNPADAIGSICAAIEIVEDRYGGINLVGPPAVIADQFAHRAFILGSPLPYHGQALDRFVSQVAMNGQVVARNVSSNVLGNPLNALSWLHRALAARGKTIAAGNVILSGSIIPTYWVSELPSTFTCTIDGGLGTLTVRVAAANAPSKRALAKRRQTASDETC